MHTLYRAYTIQKFYENFYRGIFFLRNVYYMHVHAWVVQYTGVYIITRTTDFIISSLCATLSSVFKSLYALETHHKYEIHSKRYIHELVSRKSSTRFKILMSKLASICSGHWCIMYTLAQPSELDRESEFLIA